MTDELDRLRSIIERIKRIALDGTNLDASDMQGVLATIHSEAHVALDPTFGKDAVLLKEGEGDWIAFKPGLGKDYNAVHAIRFADGQIWDTVNGWRQQP